MGQSSRRFSFDDFDELCREALEEHYSQDARMLEEDDAWVEEMKWQDHDRVFYPGQIGGVACRPTLSDGDII